MCSKVIQKIGCKPNCEGSKLGFSNNAHQNTYIYLDEKKYGIVWKNVMLFIVLHFLSFLGIYKSFFDINLRTWLFAYLYGHLGGLGVTGGAHRLWSHRSFKAKLPLRLFLAYCFTIAGQNDLYTWCRDHRVHHKYSETDADPHNSKRGFFFAHMGWLMTRKHPDVFSKGKDVDLTDLWEDPVVRYNKKFYIPLYLLINVIIPVLVPVYFFNDNWTSSILISFFVRYTTTLHCTWFVNSAAHMFGYRPYDKYIEPRENIFVSFAALGEGFHNYHHTFPWDYSTSELGYKANVTKVFIDIMALFGQAYNLKKLDPEMAKLRKKKNLES